MTILLTVILVCSMSIPAFAAQEEKEIDVIVKYVSTIEGEYKADVQNGTASVSAAGVTISVTNAPLGAVKLVVIPIPTGEEQAYEWFGDCLKNIGKPVAAYEIYFLDADGKELSVDGANVSIGYSGGKELTVCGLSVSGNYQDLSAKNENGTVTFTANNSDYFVIVQKGEKTPDMPTSPPTGDSTNLLIWIVSMVVSLFLLFFLLFWKRRKQDEEQA